MALILETIYTIITKLGTVFDGTHDRRVLIIMEYGIMELITTASAKPWKKKSEGGINFPIPPLP